MLEQIISSTARTKILRFFCLNPNEKFFIRELARRLRIQLNSIRRELNNLEDFGFLSSEETAGKKYYFTNKEFILFPEINNLVFKTLALEEMNTASKMSKIKGLKLLVFTGVLTKAPTGTDVLIVGKVNQKEFSKYLNKIADGLADELRYTYISEKEYLYRLDITDKFIYDILSNEKVVVVDKINKDKEDDFDMMDFGYKRIREE